MRIALAVFEVGGGAMNDACSDYCLRYIEMAVIVFVAVAAVVEVETVVMTDSHAVAVAVGAVTEIEEETTETAALNCTHTAHCSVHTALAPVQADIHLHKRSHIADGLDSRSLLAVRRQVLKAEHNNPLVEVAVLYFVLAWRYVGSMQLLPYRLAHCLSLADSLGTRRFPMHFH